MARLTAGYALARTGLLRRGYALGGVDGFTSLTMTGLTESAAVPGDHASISVGFPDGVTSWTSQTWGTSYGDDTYGTGANPTTYTAGNGAALYWEGVGDDLETYRSIALIRYQIATAANGLGPFAWTVDDTDTTIDFTADLTANGNTLTIVIAGLPAGCVDNGDGTATITPTAVLSGDVVATATDAYGRDVTSTAAQVTSLRAQATAAGSLGPFSFTQGVTITAQNLAADFTLNGNTGTFSIFDTALPSNYALSGIGSLTGSGASVTTAASYTVRFTDEYSRTTDSAFTLAVVEASAAPTLNSLTLTDGSGGTPPSVAVSYTYAGADDLDLVLALSDSGTAPTKAQIDAGTGGGVLGTATLELNGSSGTLEDAYTSAVDGATHAHGYLVERTNGSVYSDIESDAFGSSVDAVLPTVSGLSAASGDTQGVVSYSTSEAGTLYHLTQTAVATAPADNDAVIDGADASISLGSSGAQTDITVSSLTNGTGYTTYLVLVDAWGNKSTVYDADYTPAAASSFAFTDDFDRANENLSAGSNYTLVAGTAGAVRVVSNDLVCDDTANDAMIVENSGYTNDQAAEIDVSTASGDLRVGPIVRAGAGIFDYYSIIPDYENSNLTFKRGLIDSWSADVTFAAAESTVGGGFAFTGSYTMRIQASGTTISAYINDVLVATATDATFASGDPGIIQTYAFGGASATITEFRVEEI